MIHQGNTMKTLLRILLTTKPEFISNNRLKRRYTRWIAPFNQTILRSSYVQAIEKGRKLSNPLSSDSSSYRTRELDHVQYLPEPILDTIISTRLYLGFVLRESDIKRR